MECLAFSRDLYTFKHFYAQTQTHKHTQNSPGTIKRFADIKPKKKRKRKHIHSYMDILHSAYRVQTVKERDIQAICKLHWYTQPYKTVRRTGHTAQRTTIHSK